MTRSSVAVLITGILLATPAAPQQKPDFVITRSEVILTATVRDTTGKIVSDLERADFRIFDEGRLQQLKDFFHDSPENRQKTVIGFLVDTSNGNKIHWDKFKEAAKQLIWELLPNDPNYTGYLVSYGNNKEQLQTDTTSDPDKLTDRLDHLQLGGGAALFGAIHMACTKRTQLLGEPYEPRHVIIIIGDGHDTASMYTLHQASELAVRAQATVYAMSTQAFGAASPDSASLDRLAKDTGGHVEYPLYDPYSKVPGYLSQPSDFGRSYALPVGSGLYAATIATAINDSVQSLKAQLTSQYILRYVPEIDPATAWKDVRKIEVRIATLPAGSVTVQARSYYFPHPVGQ